MTFIVSPEAETLYFVCASIRSANVLTLQLSGDKSAESLLIFCDRLKNRVFPGRHNLFINVAPGFEVLFVLSHGLFCCRQTINVRGKLNVPAVRRLTEKEKEGAFVFRAGGGRCRSLIFRRSSLFYTAGVSVEVRWLQSPAGIQHLAPFSSELSVFVLHWSHCQGRPLLNAKALQRKKRPGVFKLLCSLSRSALSVTSARMCSHHTLSPQGLQHSLLESRPSHFTSSDDCNSPAFHAESSPTTHSNKCLSGPKACGDKDYQEELQTTTELEAFR